MNFGAINRPLLANLRRVVGIRQTLVCSMRSKSDSSDSNKHLSVNAVNWSSSSPSSAIATSKPFSFDTPKAEKEFDLLLNRVNKSTHFAELSELIAMHTSIMNSRHLSACFAKIPDFLLKAERNELRHLIRSSQEFQELCDKTLGKIRFFELDELLNILHCLVRLDVSGKTALMKAVFQMIRKQFNDLSLNQVCFLSSLLRQVKDAPEICKVISMSISLLLEVKMNAKELNFDDIDAVSRCLASGAESDLNAEKMNQLLLALRIKHTEIGEKQAFHIFKALTYRNFKRDENFDIDMAEFLFNNCMKILHETKREDDLWKLFYRAIGGKKKMMFYNKDFFEKMINWMCDNTHKVSLVQMFNCLLYLSSVAHLSSPILNKFGEKLIENKEEYLRLNFVRPHKVLNIFSVLSDYKPSFDMKSLIDIILLKKDYSLITLRNLCILNDFSRYDLFEDIILNKLSSQIANASDYDRLNLYSALLFISAGLSTHENSKDYQHMINALKPYISEAVERVSKFQEREDEENEYKKEFEPFLKLAVGGEDFIKKSVWTSNGLFVDYLMVMRQGNYPVALTKSGTFIEDFDIPPFAKIVAIKPVIIKHYCRSPPVLKNKIVFILKALRKSGIIPVTINLESWKLVPERERMPLLMREIQDACKEKADAQID